MLSPDPSMPLQGWRSATPQGLRTTRTEACSIAIGCPDPSRAHRSDVPLVDTVMGFGEARASWFGNAAEAIRLRYSLRWLLRRLITTFAAELTLYWARYPLA